MNSVLYVFLPCKKVYPIGITYLADFIHRRRPEVRQQILDMAHAEVKKLGEAEVVVLSIGGNDLRDVIDRRRPGTSRHVTQRNEPDAVEILSGVYEGLTTGTPIALLIRNTDQRSRDYGNLLRPAWYGRDESAIARECHAARHAAVVLDASSLGKLEAIGPDEELAAVSLGVGENLEKRVGGEFEKELLRVLADTGETVLLRVSKAQGSAPDASSFPRTRE